MKPETVITVLQNAAAQQSAESSQRITDKLSAFTAARDTHAASMQELKDIDTSIERCKQERQTPSMRALRRSRTGAAAFAPCAAVSPLK